MERIKLALALFTAYIMWLDNITTLFAIASGARELNPIVSFFLSDILLYTLFTAAKIYLGFYLTYKYVNIKNRESLLIWCIVMFFFIRAIIINTINIFY